MEAARQAEGLSLIAGDFNTANLLWIQSLVPIPFLGRHTRAVGNAMKESGFTTPFFRPACCKNTHRLARWKPSRAQWVSWIRFSMSSSVTALRLS